MKYLSLNRKIEKIEERILPFYNDLLMEKIIREDPILSKLSKMDYKQALFILNMAEGLMAHNGSRWNERSGTILGLKKDNYWGVKKQEVFDFLENRNGKADAINRKFIIKITKKDAGLSVKKIKRLLKELHLYLIQQVLDVSRPEIATIAFDPESHIIEEFDLDVRCPTSFMGSGPIEARISEDAKAYPTQKELTERLKQAFEKNRARWKKILAQNGLI